MDIGQLLAVNVGRARDIRVDGRTFRTAIGKTSVTGRVRIAGDHVEGDHQADRHNHGGAWQAVYAYASEDTAWWSGELGRDDLGPGTWGENLTVSGIDVSGAFVGSLWEVGRGRPRARHRRGRRAPPSRLACRGAGAVGAHPAGPRHAPDRGGAGPGPAGGTRAPIGHPARGANMIRAIPTRQNAAPARSQASGRNPSNTIPQAIEPTMNTPP